MKKVLVFGTFDNLHKGHLDFFRQAKKFGNYLVVVVARNNNVLAAKGYLPVQSEKTRLRKLRNEKLIDKAILGSKKMDYYSTLRKEKPDVICLGYDQKPKMGSLKRDLKNHDIAIGKIIRLKAYKPHLYKSSIVRKKYDSS